MRTFDEIYQIARDRHGDGLGEAIGTPPDQTLLADIPEDRWLSRFARMVFSAGFSWKVIEAKWNGFEAAFQGFDVGRCALMDDVWFDQLIQDTRIVRHGPKIASVRDNAAFLLELRQVGGVSKVIADWPSEDFIGLLDMLKKRGTRLGGTTGQYALRFMGKEGFILSRDVVARLIAEGVVDKAPTSKRALTATQEAFTLWKDQSGKSLTEISRVLALSIG